MGWDAEIEKYSSIEKIKQFFP